jgi:hypothetical protein
MKPARAKSAADPVALVVVADLAADQADPVVVAAAIAVVVVAVASAATGNLKEN